MAAHNILLEDLRRISAGIDQAIDLTGITFESDVTKWFDSTLPEPVKSIDGEPSLQLSDRDKVSVEVPNSVNVNVSLFVTSLCFTFFVSLILKSFPKQDSTHYTNYLTEESVQPFCWDDHLLNSFQSLGNQLLCLWNIFLKFHRLVHICQNNYINLAFKSLYLFFNKMINQCCSSVVYPY